MKAALLGASLLGGGALCLGAGALVLLLLGLRDHLATRRRRAGRGARLRQGLGLAALGEGALDAAVAEVATLRHVGEVPWLRVEGSAYARGVAHGRLLAPGVRRQVEEFMPRLSGEACRIAASWCLGGEAERPETLGTIALGALLDLPYLRHRVRDDLLDEAARRMAPHTALRFQDEVRGVADGAGLDPQDLVRFHAVSEVASAGCSNLAAWGTATAGGEFLQMRNLDWPLELGVQATPVLLEQASTPEFAGHLTASFAGFVGALQGGSEHGLVLGEVGAGSHAVSYDGEPMVFRLRRLLEVAEDLEGAHEVLAAPGRTKGYNFVIGDLGAGRAAAWESNRERIARFGPDDPRERAAPYGLPREDAVLRGEPALDPEVRQRQHGADGPGDPTGSWSYRYRYALLAEHLDAAGGQLDLLGMLAMARASGRRSQNLVSVVYTRAGMHVAYATGTRLACDGDYLEVPWPWTS